MAKFITDKDLIAAARLLHEHCKKNSKKCPYKPNKKCPLRLKGTCTIGYNSMDGYFFPDNWRLDKLEAPDGQ